MKFICPKCKKEDELNWKVEYEPLSKLEEMHIFFKCRECDFPLFFEIIFPQVPEDKLTMNVKMELPEYIG